MYAITQTEYYLTLLKFLAYTVGTFAGAVIFFGVIYSIVFYARYWR